MPHVCAHSQIMLACGKAQKGVRVTEVGKKVATRTKKAGGDEDMPIEIGNADAEGETEEVVVKVEGSKKGKRKAGAVSDEAPKAKKAWVNQDRGKGSLQGTTHGRRVFVRATLQCTMLTLSWPGVV